MLIQISPSDCSHRFLRHSSPQEFSIGPENSLRQCEASLHHPLQKSSQNTCSSHSRTDQPTDMNEAGGIIAELRQKLEQLDQKVLLYRREMTAQFKKYTEELLRDVPENVSNTVSQAIAESLKRYPLLHPDLQNADHICGAEIGSIALNHVATSATVAPEIVSTPALSHNIPATPALEDQNQLHEREKELHGLFTPSYLLLLDVGSRGEQRSAPAGHSPPGTDSKPFNARSLENNSCSTVTSMYPSSPSLLPVKSLLEAQRVAEEESLGSDQSDSHGRRSALRRSSSSSKPTSPRHVRFEFEGQEFPTTSSPEPESFALDAAAEHVCTDSARDGGPDYETGSQPVEYTDSTPKRISSTQALRALLRVPLEDDGTKWTEVSAPPDGSPSVPKTETEKEELGDEGTPNVPVGNPAAAILRTNGNVDSDIVGHHSSKVTSPGIDDAISTEDTRTPPLHYPSTDISKSEADTLSERPSLKYVNAKVPTAGDVTLGAPRGKYADIAQMITTAVASEARRLNLKSRSDPNDRLGSPVQFADDEVFAFDEDLPQRYEVLHEEEESDHSLSETEGTPPELSQYATSPAVPILKPGILSSISKSSTPTQPSSHRFSYHPFNTPIVSEAIHAQAASLGNVVTFVGSLHGASGLDESDVQSFRGSGGIGSFAGGVPLSFSERLAMEDALENQHGDPVNN